jgi:uncharacterized protein YgiM (DUF1202 family)
MNKRLFLVTLLVAALTLAACGPSTPDPAFDPNAMMTLAFATVNAAGTQTALAKPTDTPVPTGTPPPTFTPKPAFEPTVILTATVSVPTNVRFGPDTDYAGPGGLRTGKTVEVIGRNAAGDWLLVREIGGKKSSWVYAANLTVQGEIGSLAVAPVILPITPNYAAPANIRTARAGDQVQITWDAVEVNYKDAYPDSSYFLETWTCSSGQLVYSIHAVKETTVTITDQPGCAEKSHGLLYTTTRDGYSVPAEIPWPAP